METAYLYIRVSTDEQKKKGYSLPEQEDRLLKYCEDNDIRVKGIFSEDHSAKTFRRPAWEQLLAVIKKDKSSTCNNILFIKWDRFSRNIQNAYEMLGILRKYNTTAIAIDQPIDLLFPKVLSCLLFTYLSQKQKMSAEA
ncbi:recombinase family protein [Mucilaginibacter corticis]|uniref:recombinase family protein n=1 Tax=Mucilaginibacter corticis TaxID=2597670 RepID=UPI001C90A56F|nr:recombinase family protein [Mucilaginibacter corticis]